MKPLIRMTAVSGICCTSAVRCAFDILDTQSQAALEVGGESRPEKAFCGPAVRDFCETGDGKAIPKEFCEFRTSALHRAGIAPSDGAALIVVSPVMWQSNLFWFVGWAIVTPLEAECITTNAGG